jgi:hypothetical protein
MKAIDFKGLLENLEYWCNELKKDSKPFTPIRQDIHGLERAIAELKIALEGEKKNGQGKKGKNN